MGAPHHSPRDYSQTPLNVYWEVTQACALACRHCRAEAVPHHHPLELDRAAGLALLEQIAGFGEPKPHLILTGGDPLEREDLFELIDAARALDIAVSITPAATSALTRDVLAKLKQHGIDGLGLSLDGSSPERHDSIRQVPGTFDRTMQAMQWAKELEIPLQVNTLAAAETADDIPAIYELLKPMAVARWSMFFLISVGRGRVLAPLDPPEAEKLMAWIHETSRTADFIVATTEAPSYRRVALERMREEGQTGEAIRRSGVARGFGIRDGHGIVFVSNTGDICPAGFLPLVAGNVRKDNLVDVYRNAPLFQSLHDPTQFGGHCGVCEYHALCGGSRARAYGATGDPLAQDPLCVYEPKGLR
ncbi:MAG: TIGR04053 family radical SAM/SPASM domain-containing protein [Bryobacterales bacterium]